MRHYFIDYIFTKRGSSKAIKGNGPTFASLAHDMWRSLTLLKTQPISPSLQRQSIGPNVTLLFLSLLTSNVGEVTSFQTLKRDP